MPKYDRNGVMKMTKTMLVKWLEEKHIATFNKVREQYNQVMDDYKETWVEKTRLRETAVQIAELISKADDICEEWIKKTTNAKGISRQDVYGSLKHKLEGILTPKEIERCLLSNICDNSPELETLNRREDEVEAEIDKNFKNVIRNVKGMKDAKAGMEYLKELGFDLSDLIEKDKNPTTALAAPVDTKFLFLGR